MLENERKLSDLVSDAKSYVDGRLDEVKLKTVRGLSLSISRILWAIVFIAVLLIILSLLSDALLGFLNGVFGEPFGTLMVCGFWLVVLAVLFFLRNRMFRNSLVKLFINVFYSGEDE
ncbi:MAG: hypothetical protein MJY42_01605 [Bacteroidales bacterium]|nr:hypothetical protein [Bacteroidales bacterium]